MAAADVAPPTLQVKKVTPARWADFERLFEARGSPGYCYCMAWRATAKTPGGGPFDTFRGLRKTEEPTEKIWSVTCFFVSRAHRGQGFTRQLLDAAVRHAKKHGARLVEGYPVDPESPSYRHMGFVSLFKSAGFKETGREGSRRHVMQLPLKG